LGELRAVKVIHRSRFNDERPFEREFEGIQRFEPISRSHPSQLAILQQADYVVHTNPGSFHTRIAPSHAWLARDVAIRFFDRAHALKLGEMLKKRNVVV
jgi:hypothetical protein